MHKKYQRGRFKVDVWIFTAMETSNASQFAGFALQVICRQEWVRERCLQDPQVLCSPELLLDPAISPNQVSAHFAMEGVCD